MQFFRKLIISTTDGPYWVMYDNECSFCYKLTSLFKRFDYFDKIQWIDKNWNGDFPADGRNMIKKTVVVYDPSKKELYYKSSAVSKIIKCIPLGFAISWVLILPGLSIIFDRIYDLISRNRMKLL